MAKFNPEHDGMPVYLSGLFPAHVIHLETREHGDNTFHDVIFLISESAKKIDGHDRSGNKLSGSNMVGKTVRIKIMSYLNNPGPKERWKNAEFYKQATAMGVKFGKVDDEINGQKVKSLDLRPITEDEVIGAPVIIKTDFEYDNRDKDKPKDKQRSYCKAFEVLEHTKGTSMTPDAAMTEYVASMGPKKSNKKTVEDDEDLPF